MRIRIPYWPKRRLIIEIKRERMMPLADYHMSEYERSCWELAGMDAEIQTSKRKDEGKDA